MELKVTNMDIDIEKEAVKVLFGNKPTRKEINEETKSIKSKFMNDFELKVELDIDYMMNKSEFNEEVRNLIAEQFFGITVKSFKISEIKITEQDEVEKAMELMMQ